MSAARMNLVTRHATHMRAVAFAFGVWLAGLAPAWAQEPAIKPDAMPGMDHSDVQGRTSAAEDTTPGREEVEQRREQLPGMSEAAQMDHSKMGHGTPPKEAATGDTMGDGMKMDHGAMQGGDPPPDARDPHAYSGGHTRGPLRLADEHNLGSLLVDRFESARGRDNTELEYDLQAWYGRDYDRAVFKAEGEHDGGKLRDARTELLWGHAVATYWDAQLGVRYDGGAKAGRKWLAFGVQGLAPYWFEVEAAAYVGEEGRSALRLETEYELLLTQKWILQPRVEVNFYGKSDPTRELGSGLSDAAAGVRLRYEIRRELAPYVGVEWTGKYGGTADFARADGERTRDTRLVAGVRFWF